MSAALDVLRLSGAPQAMGEAHGRARAADIRAYFETRLALAAAGTAFSRAALIGLAEECLPAHRDYAPDLFAEMCALAHAAGLSPAEAVIVGGYTDFIDLVRARAGSAPVEDACTAWLVPAKRSTDGHALLAQSWDMNASAEPYVLMLDVRPEGGPAARVFSTAGCLGQIGMNDAGVAIGINNLTAADGAVGVTWPFVVRKALQQRSAAAALECVRSAPLAGGHSFLVLDAEDEGYVIEAMPTATSVRRLEKQVAVHANHCLDDATRRVEGPRPAVLAHHSEMRQAHATEWARQPVSVAGLMEWLRDTRSICRDRNEDAGFDFKTCGAVIMQPATRALWACAGPPSLNAFRQFPIPAQR